MRAIRALAFLAVFFVFLAQPASAVYIRINAGGVSFTSTGAITLGSDNATTSINFNTPVYAGLQTSGNIGLAGSTDFTLTNSTTLTINEGNGAIESGETGARTFRVTFSNLDYSFDNSTWYDLASQWIEISSASGLNPSGSRIPINATNALNDSCGGGGQPACSDSDTWDLRFLFNGVSTSWTLADGNVLRAQIFGPDGWTGSSINPVEWNYNGDTEMLYARFFYDTPEPATFVLIGSALVGIGLLRRRRRG
ncbi:MAG: PEP-CTERM sorting domain-containing protein [Bryobacteraceae bacterium]